VADALDSRPNPAQRRVQCLILRISSEHYDVVDAQDQVIGTAFYTASTSLKPPFKTTHYLVVQKHVNGNVIVEKRW
jgi:hypothetical protein